MDVAASVITLIHITGQVFDLCWTYYSDAKDARTEIQQLRDEMTSLQVLLNKVKDLVDVPNSTSFSNLSLLDQPNGPLQQCLVELLKLVAKLNSGQENEKMRKFGLGALKWPFGKKEVDKVISAIERHKAMFNLALAADQT